jgi:glycosyltransferase involved in cell wall biosynthesis
MRITYTSILNPWDQRSGGGQCSAHDLAVAMAHRGHDVRFIYSGSRSEVPTGDLPYRAVVVPHHERLYLNPLEFLRALPFVYLHTDILHTHGYEGALLAGALRRRSRVVSMTHHPDPPTLTDAPPISRPFNRIAWYRRSIIPLLERRALRSGHVVVCVSRYSARTLRTRGYLGPDCPTRVVHNGCNPFDGVGDVPADVEFVCAARLDKHKGIDVLLRAVALVEGPPPNVDLLGIGPEEKPLRDLAASLGLAGRVRFRGLVGRQEVGAFLARATALVLPSLAENFPRAILEGLCVGVPIVTTLAGGIPEAVEDQKEALLVPPGDVAALANALSRLRGDVGLRERLRAAALARAADFTWERSAEQLEELYVSMLRNHKLSWYRRGSD